VDVFVGFPELEIATVELALDTAEAALDRCELGLRDESRRGEAPCVRDAAGNVEGVELEIGLERRGEPLELRVKRLAKARPPELSRSPSGRGA
jgi:hypothetical protein